MNGAQKAVCVAAGITGLAACFAVGAALAWAVTLWVV